MDSQEESKIIAVSPSNVFDTEKMKYLLASAKENNVQIEIIGLGKPFNFLSKITLLRDFLSELPTDENPIVCFTDAYDVFYVSNLDTIKAKFLSLNSSIVWSVERYYSHQLQKDKAFYDNLSRCTNSPYKYINTGTFIGYKKNLLELMNDICVSIENGDFVKDLTDEGWNLTDRLVDQPIISHHFVKFWNKYQIRLDTMCSIFYVPSGDWFKIDRYINNQFVVADTKHQTSIVHVPNKPKQEHILKKLYYLKYESDTIFFNMEYSWTSDSIVFHEDGTMDAFGKGTYTAQDAHTFLATFGGREHRIVFSKGFTEFVSTRTKDGMVVRGKVIWKMIHTD
jgi:hypothetical protein